MSDYRIGDEVYIHGIIDEIRKDTIIIKNEGGYFGTVADEIMPSVQPEIIRCKDCNYACIDPERESDEIYCSENDFWKDDDFYCGYAERREK